MKDVSKNGKQNYFFLCAYRLSGTGTVKCSEIIDVGCNQKQFDGLTWPWPPYFTTDLRHCQCQGRV